MGSACSQRTRPSQALPWLPLPWASVPTQPSSPPSMRCFCAPVAFEDAERLVVVWEAKPSFGLDYVVVSPPNYVDWRDQNRVFEEMSPRHQRGTGGHPRKPHVGSPLLSRW
jgi:hypothetical protein